ncbi:MAG: glycosyltransferase family 39 protein [Chloroflexi bacterium]|nr:glycosyltransferase family 39 protein [Chloroflexota bacterium]
MDRRIQSANQKVDPGNILRLPDSQSLIWLFPIVALALGLRLWGVSFGLPFFYHPDEGVPVNIALRILRDGNLHPGFYHWPSLLFYFNAFVYGIFFLIGRITGRFTAITDLAYPDIVTVAVGRAGVPEELLIGRAAQAMIGALAIVWVYLICRHLARDPRAGLIGALFLAVETISVRNNQFIRPESLLVFFLLGTVFFSLKIIDDPRPRHYALAAISAGLAASSKYNAGLGVILILSAHLMRFGIRGFARREIYFAGAISALAFFAGTPFALLDWRTFLQSGIAEDAAIYAGGHAGGEGDTLRWYIEFLWQTQGALLLLALAEIVIILRRRDLAGIALISFPAIYFSFVSAYRVRFDTTILPVIPFIVILAARLIARGWNFNSRFARGAVLVLICALILPPLRATVDYNTRLLQIDGRETARQWIEKNLPAGARFAVEPYAPYIARPRYTVSGVAGMTEHPPEWYRANGFEYLVFSYGAFGRFYENRAAYPDFVARYEALFAAFPEIKRFNENGMEIRVHQTNAANLPAHKSGERWGVYAEWIEFVGYDGATPRDLVLYWRALSTRRTPYQLTVILRDENDHARAQTTGDLFGELDSQNQGRDEIVRVPIDLAVPSDLAPGRYRLELNVDAEGIGRIPRLALDRQPVSDKHFLAVKIPPPAPSPNEIATARLINVRFDNTLLLLGHAPFRATVRAGDALLLTTYWQGIAKIDRDLTLFLHLLDAPGNLRAQLDTQPVAGAYPTSLWDAGEIVRDESTLTLPRDLAPGKYRLALGWYSHPTLARLTVGDANGAAVGDQIILAEITIE